MLLESYTSVGETASAIDKYGPYAVILAVVLVLFYFIIRSNNKALRKFEDKMLETSEAYRESIAEQNNTLIEQLLNTANNVNIDHQKQLFDTFIKLRTAIKDSCKSTMMDLKADRLAIYLFHNGSHSTHGINFFKMSCICESIVIGSGIRERSTEHSNIPINLLDDMVEELIVNGRYNIINDSTIDNTNRKIFKSNSNIKYSKCVSIFDENNNIMGFALADFEHELDPETDKKEFKIMKAFTKQICPILSYSNYIDININKTNKTS